MSTIQRGDHHAFTQHCKFLVGNGSLSSFWLDNWIRDIPLK
jgi:hypothetical protein